jgi:hypothetical protein
MKSITRTLVRLILSLLATQVARAGPGNLHPFLPYDITRTPHDAVSALRSSQRWPTFVRELAQLSGKPGAEVDRLLQSALTSRDCPGSDYLMAAGIRPNTQATGYVHRACKSGEQIACITDRVCVSGYCGNPVLLPAPLTVPPPPPTVEEEWVPIYLCSQGPTSYTMEYYPSYASTVVTGWWGGSAGLAAASSSASATVIVDSGSAVFATALAVANTQAYMTVPLFSQQHVTALVTGITVGHTSGWCRYVLQKK